MASTSRHTAERRAERVGVGVLVADGEHLAGRPQAREHLVGDGVAREGGEVERGASSVAVAATCPTTCP